VPVASSRIKREVLRQLLRAEDVSTAMIFANRKTTVRELNKSLQGYGFSSGEIHGDMDQPARIAELDRFKDGKINILCCSDVAARGLDVKGVSHVFNFDTPWHPDDYVHRIGRTGRAGASGKAFTLVAPEDAEAIDNVEKLTGMTIPVFEVQLEGRAERPARDRAARDGDEPKPRSPRARAPRAEREEPKVPAERAAPAEPRADRPAKPEPRRESRARRSEPVDPPSQPGEWNGPVPDFLGFSAG
jgi:superfamily II DNA/RNA helicase